MIFDMVKMSVEVSNECFVKHMKNYRFETVFVEALDSFRKVEILCRFIIADLQMHTFCYFKNGIQPQRNLIINTDSAKMETISLSN